MSVESTYLYSEQNQELYRQVLREMDVQSCPHSRQIMAAMDLQNELELSPGQATHMSNCDYCRKAYQQNSRLLTLTQNMVPKVAASRESQALFESELSDRLKNMQRIALARQRAKFQNAGINFIFAGRDLFAIFLKPAMLKAYLVAGASFGLLKLILN